MRTFFFLSILICLANRLWQFDTQKNLFEYPLGKSKPRRVVSCARRLGAAAGHAARTSSG